MKDILETYKNYLHALEYQKQYGNEYYDEIALRVFEKQLLEYHIKIYTKEGNCEEEKIKIKKIY